MKKVIVFQVENVLVKAYDEVKLDEVRGRKMVKEWVGGEFFEKEFLKGLKEKKEMMSCGEMLEKMRELEKRFEEEGEVMKRYWMRDVRKRLEEWEDRGEERRDELKKKNFEDVFEKKVIEKRNDLKDLERMCEVVGGKMIFVSGKRRLKVERLLINNGLRKFELRGDWEFLKEEDGNEVVVFDSVDKLKEMWKEIGLKIKC